jgi:hypothetical protein
MFTTNLFLLFPIDHSTGRVACACTDGGWLFVFDRVLQAGQFDDILVDPEGKHVLGLVIGHSSAVGVRRTQLGVRSPVNIGDPLILAILYDLIPGRHTNEECLMDPADVSRRLGLLDAQGLGRLVIGHLQQLLPALPV